MRNKFFKILTGILITCCLMSLTGCGNCSDIRRRCTFYEQGDFRYTIYPIDYKSKDELYIILDGLTEEGKTREVVIIPEEIDGMPVKLLSDQVWMSSFGQLESDKLESIYIMGIPSCIRDYTFGGVPNLKKIVFQKAIKWFKEEYYTIFVDYPGYIKYIPSYAKEDVSLKYCIYANLSYMYNYEGAENEGYYWVDNFDYGGTIGYKPENPEREGYVFGGWFKEQECENIWDFDKDTLPELKSDEEGREVYQETRLYAKWYKK